MAKTLKIVALLVLQLIMTVFTVLMIYFIYACTGLAFSVGEEEVAGGVKMYVRSNGVHTDLVMPTESEQYNWKGFIDSADYRYNHNFEYVAIGWGDKGFFLDTPTWAELSMSTALNAIFLPSPCAMHVEYFDREPETSDLIKEMHITEEGYVNMISYIEESFVLKGDKPILIPNESYTGYDHFYEAKGNYHMFETCNSWTNGGLKSAGVVTAAWAVFPGDVMEFRK